MRRCVSRLSESSAIPSSTRPRCARARPRNDRPHSSSCARPYSRQSAISASACARDAALSPRSSRMFDARQIANTMLTGWRSRRASATVSSTRATARSAKPRNQSGRGDRLRLIMPGSSPNVCVKSGVWFGS